MAYQPECVMSVQIDIVVPVTLDAGACKITGEAVILSFGIHPAGVPGPL